MENRSRNNKKIVIVSVAVLTIIFFGVVLWFAIRNMIFSATVNMIVAPTVAKIKIGDTVYDAVGEYKIAPGEYDVEIFADGFEEQSMTINVKKDETTNISIYLIPTEENVNWYNDHPEDALIMGEIVNAETVKKLQELGNKNPVLNDLPYIVDYYTSDYSKRINYAISYEIVDNDAGFRLLIKDYSGGNREVAEEWLVSEGVNVDDNEIVYQDLTEESLSARAE